MGPTPRKTRRKMTDLSAARSVSHSRCGSRQEGGAAHICGHICTPSHNCTWQPWRGKGQRMDPHCFPRRRDLIARFYRPGGALPPSQGFRKRVGARPGRRATRHGLYVAAGKRGASGQETQRASEDKVVRGRGRARQGSAQSRQLWQPVRLRYPRCCCRAPAGQSQQRQTRTRSSAWCAAGSAWPRHIPRRASRAWSQRSPQRRPSTGCASSARTRWCA